MQHNLRLTKGHDRDTYRAHYNPPQTTAANGQNPTERDTPPIQLTRAREPPPPSHARQSGLTHQAACHNQEREPPVDGGTAKQGPCLPRAPPHDNPPLHNPPPTKTPSLPQQEAKGHDRPPPHRTRLLAPPPPPPPPLITSALSLRPRRYTYPEPAHRRRRHTHY